MNDDLECLMVKKAIKNTQISNLTSQKHKLELYKCANVSSLTNISKLPN